MAESPVLLTVKEAAERMRVSKMTVYRLINSGDVGAVRFGRTLRVAAADVERLLQPLVRPAQETSAP